MTEEQILITNIILYLAALPVFVKRCGLVSVATMAWILYLVCAIMSYLYYISPIYFLSFAFNEYIVPEALWFLFGMNFLLCYMLRLFDFPKADIIHNYDDDVCRKIELVLTVIFGIIVVISLPIALSKIMSGDLAALRDEGYEKGFDSGVSGILSYFLRLFNPCAYLLLIIPIFHFIVLRKLSNLDKVALIVFAGQMITIITMAISRAMMVTVGLFVLALFVMGRKYLKAKVIKWVMLISLPIIFGALSLFSTITTSRFGQTEGDDTEEQYANLRYAGESMLNYSTMMYDKTYRPAYGYQQFQLYRRALGMRYYGEKKSLDVDILNEYFDDVHPYPNYIFYTAAGNLYMEWGKWPPFIVLLAINVWIGVIRRRIRQRGILEFNFFWYVLGTYLSYVVCYGIFYMEMIGEGGNMLWLLLPALYLILRGHNLYLNGASPRPRRIIHRLQ